MRIQIPLDRLRWFPIPMSGIELLENGFGPSRNTRISRESERDRDVDFFEGLRNQ